MKDLNRLKVVLAKPKKAGKWWGEIFIVDPETAITLDEYQKEIEY